MGRSSHVRGKYHTIGCMWQVKSLSSEKGEITKRMSASYLVRGKRAISGQGNKTGGSFYGVVPGGPRGEIVNSIDNSTRKGGTLVHHVGLGVIKVVKRWGRELLGVSRGGAK